MNYYEILNVKRDATSAEIRKSYKTLMKKYHPDIYDGDKKVAEARSMEINAAYDVLSNPETRSRYDFELDNSSTSNNFSNTTYENSASQVQDDFYNMYKDYEQIKNNTYSHYNPYSYENYKRTKSQNANSRAFYTDLYEKNIEKAENYVSSKLDKLQLWQRIILIAILILFMFASMLISSISFFKHINKYTIDKNNELEDDFFEYPKNFIFENSINSSNNTINQNTTNNEFTNSDKNTFENSDNEQNDDSDIDNSDEFSDYINQLDQEITLEDILNIFQNIEFPDSSDKNNNVNSDEWLKQFQEAYPEYFENNN